ncbi:50S RIBOSOMAL PROTEIN L15 [Mycoplasmopsis pulmonis]|uniref:Large ribosomal subunit protein uL15 n=1 Tax=Mycoplasmopsis pulmonis (strain UAB CTIP) TaxID=272635 RepID=RL15_MYCPU|nr:50S ribosomal protein L15 [Mycoplasmopsis pulmonis]Q98Q00.1 RecName: Full=Large ribosomal subunit protein uL15; AltName: Full=50S ribosomal protein L15 [Mycoplasmopsis pulmonis UAB CTIP]MDZ7293627.1 50S ribosomal protein L15 [Mycoplasmopsis pulmonis]CAC13742.1 50S RIBOSOMAL PROTEIN L15 [Mycoplasmopsis pulmonis]VEU68333.1 50S ribosomal protein L15 [Mycoplasmopsis pulmonis]
MELHSLKSTPGSRKEKHRKGRGHAAGKGKQAGKGQSGQRKRSKVRLGFEGGQNPWFRRLPKRGFKNINHIEYQPLSLEALEKHFLENEVVDLEKIYEKRLVTKRTLPVKLLANGKLTKKLTIHVHSASQSAIQAVESLGGKVEVL